MDLLKSFLVFPVPFHPFLPQQTISNILTIHPSKILCGCLSKHIDILYPTFYT